MFQQHYLEPFYIAWERFKGFLGTTFYRCIPNEELHLSFFYGLNEDTKRWVDERSLVSGCSFLSRNGDDAYSLLEDMASYNYYWHISRHHGLVCEDILLHEEPMEQLEEEPSFLEEVESSPQEVKECVLPMILTLPQPTPKLPKIHHFPFEFSTPSYREVPYFVDHKDTWPPILFKLTYFMAESPRVVDYATLHGRTPYFEDTESLANDFNFSASWEATQAT